MMPRLKGVILRLLDEHRVLTIATNRPDGWPQATTVCYVNDGFLLYCFVARNSQKHANVLRDPRVSVAIGERRPAAAGDQGPFARRKGIRRHRPRRDCRHRGAA